MSKVVGEASMVHGISRSAASVAVVSVALFLGGCAQSGGDINLGLGGDKPKTVDIATASAGERPEAELEKATTYWGEQHGKNPRDPKAAIAYARNLKALGRKAQALSVMQSSYPYAPDDKDFLSEYGRLSLELGQVSTAEQLLLRADDPAKPDWRILSARGTVLAKQGRFKDSIEFFEKARSLAPEQASLMNNLAMAYTMDGQAARGEALLRQAAGTGTTDPRVQQNLALVVGLQSKGADDTAGATPAVAAGSAMAEPVKTASWGKALPMEQAAAPAKAVAKAASKPAPKAAAAATDPDAVIRQAMAAENAKPAKR